jgi:prevent-host-death family protein
MNSVNVHQAKTHLSRLLERVANGETVVIAKAGKPLAKLAPLDPTEPAPRRRLGFLEGQIATPADFDRMGETEIETMFSGKA